MAIDLPDIEQTFKADVDPYIMAIQVAVAETKKLGDSITEVLGQITALKSAIAGLEGKDITIHADVVYDMPDLSSASQAIRITTETGGTDTVTDAAAVIREAGAAAAAAEQDFSGVAETIVKTTDALQQESTAYSSIVDAIRDTTKATTEAADSEDKIAGGVLDALAALQAIVQENARAGESFGLISDAVAGADSEIELLIDSSMLAAKAQGILIKAIDEAAKEISREGGDAQVAADLVTDAALHVVSAQKLVRSATEETSKVITDGTYDAVRAEESLREAVQETAFGSSAATQTFLALGRAQAFADQEGIGLIRVAQTLRSALGGDSEEGFSFAAALHAAGANMKALAAAAGGDGGGGFLSKLLGGAAGGGAARGLGRFFLVGGTIAGIAAWHVVLDVLAEAFIAVGSAAGVAAIGIATLQPALADIHDHTQAIWDVNSALGNQIPGLIQQFKNLSSSMAPQALEIYGGALNLVTGNTGAFARTAHAVVDLFSTWVAKIDIWAKNSGILNKLLADGVGFLGQFGQLFGTLGDALKNTLGAMPGIAHFIMDVVIAGAKLIDLFTKLPQPIFTFILAVHGAYVWGRILASILTSIGNAAVRMGKSMLALATNPFFWVAVAAAGLGYLAIKGSEADKSVSNLIRSMETKLNTESASQAIMQIAQNIGILQQHINNLNVSTINQQFSNWSLSWSRLGQVAQEAGYSIDAIWGHMVNSLSAFGHGDVIGAIKDQFQGLWDLVSGGGGPAVQFSRDIAAMNAEINKMLGSSRNLFGEIGHLMDRGKTYGQSLAIMNLAGVRWNDTADVMRQKVDNLIHGYNAMSIQGRLLSNSVNAITFATDIQDSKVGQLTQSWSTFFSTVSGGASGFVSFAQALGGTLTTSLRNVSGATTSTIRTQQGLAQAFATAHGNMTGLSNASLSAQGQFIQTAQAAQTEMNNLTNMASAAGLGARGTRMLTQAAKDMISTMLPAAQHSKTLTGVLYALAQQGGYQGADSFKALSEWVGKTKNPMKDLQGIVQTFTLAAGNLLTDVKNLSTALGQTLTQAMSSAIFYADGGQNAFNQFAQALHNNSIQSQTVHDKAQTLASMLITLTGNTSNAHRQFDTMTIAMGYTRAEADKLWRSVENTAAAIARLHNKSVTISEEGVGKFSITGPTGFRAQGPGGHNSPFVAAGGLITGPGTATSDSIPARLSTGEYVIQAAAVAKYGKGMMDAINARHFDTGGFVGSVSGLPAFTNRFDSTFQNDFTRSMQSSMTTALKSAINSAQAAAAVTSTGRPISGGRGIFSQQQLESLWIMAGGPPGLAHLMAAIADAESGGNPNAFNPSGASGLWQILGQIVGGNIFNPVVNAENAVMKYLTQGLGAWVTYTSGAYKAYMDEGGWLRPGLNMVMNNTGQAEQVLPPGGGGDVHVHPIVSVQLDGREIFRAMASESYKYNVRNGPGAMRSGVLQPTTGATIFKRS